jgi:hypothetical protein
MYIQQGLQETEGKVNELMAQEKKGREGKRRGNGQKENEVRVK